MGLFDQFPYTNFHELNLDWILRALRELEHTIDQFVAINALKYADPIQWNITSQYEKNTIVIDPQSGTAYISVQPVPAGVALTNTDYWTVVFDLEQFVTKANNNFTLRVEPLTTLTATFPVPVNGWVIWGGDLYKALVNITAGDQYVVDSNIKRITVEDVTGYVDELQTTIKTNIVAAINELVANIGDLTLLDTTDKSNVVAAINDVLQILVSKTGELSDLDTTDKSNLVAAINELVDKVGDLTLLNTTDKSNVVAAINETLQKETQDISDILDGSLAFSNLNAPGSLTFNSPTSYSRYFDMLPYTDPNGVTHNLLTAGADIDFVGAAMYVNVLLYGADPTGVEDSTAAIQNAIAVAAGGGVVYFPRGTYKITSTIMMDHNVSLLGDSMKGSILRFDFNNHVGINYVGKDIRGTFISKLSIVRAAKDNSSTEPYPAWLKDAGILFGCITSEYNSAIITIEDVFIQNWRIGISGAAHHGESNGIGLFDSCLKNVWIDNCVNFGLALGGSGNVIIEPRLTLNGGAFCFIHVSDESFDGCTILGGVVVASAGYDITFRDGGQFRPITFNGLWFEQSGFGIINLPFANTRLMNLSFIGCMLNSNTTSYDMFAASGNISTGIVEMLNCTAYQTIAGGNNNIALPATTSSCKGIASNCIKIASNGTVTLYEDLT